MICIFSLDIQLESLWASDGNTAYMQSTIGGTDYLCAGDSIHTYRWLEEWTLIRHTTSQTFDEDHYNPDDWYTSASPVAQ